MEFLRVESQSLFGNLGKVDLTFSKSITNRALVLKQTSGSSIELIGISPSNDSKVLQQLLQSNSEIWDVEDAGTAFRFLVAYACLSQRKVIIQGKPRLHERPIKPLVDSLLEIGFQISYLEKSGFAPLLIHGTQPDTFPQKIKIDCSQSSQFASALLLVSPLFPHPVELELYPEKPASLPYIQTTLSMLNDWGIPAQWISKNSIRTASQSSSELRQYCIEKDWSSAGFWYELACFHPGTTIQLNRLSLKSIQADRITALYFSYLGIETVENESGILIKKTENADNVIREINFWETPDLFPCLALSIASLEQSQQNQFTLTGLETLAHKESNRLEAIGKELEKLGVSLYEEKPGFWKISGKLSPAVQPISSYKDHRITMAFAIAGTKLGLTIENPETVNKSYPDFWNELGRLTQKSYLTTL